MRLLPKLLKKAIKKGTLRLRGPKGEVHLIGGLEDGPEVSIEITDPSYDWKIVLNPELYAGEAYMHGALKIETGDIYSFLELFFLNKRSFDLTASQIYWKGVARKLKRFQQHNPIARARANVKHHYDLGNELYRLFLDEDMQYSCGYYAEGVQTLEEAQLAKKRHLAAKLGLEDGQRILEIGCGWGGLSLYLSQLADVEITAVTLSKEQIDIARARAAAASLTDRVNFKLCDYREVSGTFDRVISVGMLEHVGVGHLDEYFLNVRDRLSADGLALIHSISSKAPPGITGPFLAKYIFPGGYSPSLSEAITSVEHSGLWALDIEIWRKHYGHTLREWRMRCAENKDQIIKLYDEKFYRMWEFYLAACEGAFMHGASHVFQMQLARSPDAAPLTRGYVEERTVHIKESEPLFLGKLQDATDEAFAGLSF
ncbi:MAG: cyclopropane-fatty-acyl-phospholipid synthase [Methyloligella sp.]|nr:MAG: cyclopropane-fatty-acyl-phospholipid synthase [Methyloligella sp.]